ncbi:G-protein coupled receptor 4-like [Mugil cephalus]|uniref:G-protein coupled receptor 4-like n=1 Tax=Mugil cephalus TaxID=48193 RepID=UPI001FB79504|nr:G-protein coupled receptor 4-like [Mugil cephalus]
MEEVNTTSPYSSYNTTTPYSTYNSSYNTTTPYSSNNSTYNSTSPYSSNNSTYNSSYNSSYNSTSPYSSYNESHHFCNIRNLWNDFDLFHIFDYSSITLHNGSETNEMESHIESVLYVTRWVVICIGLPLTMVAIYAFYTMVRNDHIGPIYVINLLISDLIQLCCMIVWVTKINSRRSYNITYFIYVFGLLTSVGFMVCVALERYLIIAWPLWYRFKRTIKVSVVVCVLVWTISFVTILVVSLANDFIYPFILLTISLLLPFPLLVFSLAGTLKALSASISVSSEDKRRIVGVLVLVLLNYTLMFLPTIILSYCRRDDSALHSVSFTLIQLSPLADLILYVFMRKGGIEKLLSVCKMDVIRSSLGGRFLLHVGR